MDHKESNNTKSSYDGLIAEADIYEKTSGHDAKIKALELYEKAVRLAPHKPEPYLGLSRTTLCACTGTHILTHKLAFAERARSFCDLDTLEWIQWPEINLFVGLSLKCCAETFAAIGSHDEAARKYYKHAADYLAAGRKMKDVNGTAAPCLCNKELKEISKRNCGTAPDFQKLDLG